MADDAAPTGDEIDPRRLMWRSGSYEIVGDWFRSASVAVLDGLELEGRRLLDVATGTGAVAIEAARRGADVVAVDLTDELVQSARRRSAGAGVDIGFVVGDFDQSSTSSSSGSMGQRVLCRSTWWPRRSG